MGCGCGKGRMARPSGATVTSSIPSQRMTGETTKVIAGSSPYGKQSAPAHLQEKIASNARRKV